MLADAATRRYNIGVFDWRDDGTLLSSASKPLMSSNTHYRYLLVTSCRRISVTRHIHAWATVLALFYRRFRARRR